MLTCQDCGIKSEEVEETVCPYAEDIYGEIIEVRLCQDCYDQRCDDI